MSTVSSDRLSPRQQRILEFLRQFTRARGYPPTIREMCKACGISSTSVVDYNLNIMEKRGYLRRDPEISRGLEMLDRGDGRQESNVVSLPIVGRIAAGEPIEAISGENERIQLTRDVAPQDAYVLKVKGKSMIEDLIDDGDLVVIRPQSTADNGDIVVALIPDGPTGEGQATLKRFYREKGLVRLQPANVTMQPIYVSPAQLRIQGKVVAVVRQLQ